MESFGLGGQGRGYFSFWGEGGGGGRWQVVKTEGLGFLSNLPGIVGFGVCGNLTPVELTKKTVSVPGLQLIASGCTRVEGLGLTVWGLGFRALAAWKCPRHLNHAQEGFGALGVGWSLLQPPLADTCRQMPLHAAAQGLQKKNAAQQHFSPVWAEACRARLSLT